MRRLFQRGPRIEPEPEPVAMVESGPVEPVPVEEWATGVVLMSDGLVDIHVASIDQAKLAIKQLRLKKRELNTQKRSVNADIKSLRIERREQVAQQGSKMVGGGKIGRIVRAGQTAGRDADRRQHVANLAPHEEVKGALDHNLTNLDRVITRIEQWIIEQG